MASGYVKLHRESMDHEVFADPWLWKVFCWCIMRANFRDAQVPRGSFTTGRHQAAELLDASPSKVYRAFQRLNDIGCIEVKANSKWTTISVCNYETYQSDEQSERTTDEQQMNNERTTDEQPADTLKEGKKGRSKERTPLPPSLDTPEFKLAWDDFGLHRSEIRKPLTTTAERKLLAKLERWGSARSIAALEHSIANGWRGVFEPDSSKDDNGKAGRPLTEDEYDSWNPVDGGGA